MSFFFDIENLNKQDENYTRVLFDNPSFDLNTVYLIDRVQKHEAITKDELKELRKLGVVEGKLPNIYISATVAEIVDEKARYIKNKAFDDDAYKKWITSYLESYGKGKKSDFINLLSDKLPATMDSKQKEAKVKYLLSCLSKEDKITTDSTNHRLAN